MSIYCGLCRFMYQETLTNLEKSTSSQRMLLQKIRSEHNRLTFLCDTVSKDMGHVAAQIEDSLNNQASAPFTFAVLIHLSCHMMLLAWCE